MSNSANTDGEQRLPINGHKSRHRVGKYLLSSVEDLPMPLNPNSQLPAIPALPQHSFSSTPQS